MLGLKEIEREIQRKRKKQSKLEEEIDQLLDKRADYIAENCEYNEGDTCGYDNSPRNRDGYSCLDCAYHLDIFKLKKGSE